MSFFVYLLECTDQSTYVGATVDLDHRLRQHNGELVGGAHATHCKIALGNAWERVCHIRGFPDWRTALQFEWRFKQLGRKYPKRMFPLERRLRSLKELMALERPTTKAMAYSEWPTPPHIEWEAEHAMKLFESL